jgi:hypothetical protein
MRTGVVKVKVTGEPPKVVHIVSGSVPNCSLVVPVAEVVAGPGKVTGICTEHVLPVAVTVTAVILFPSAE